MSALPISRPQIDTRPNLRVVSGTRPKTAIQVMTGMIAFSAITVLTFGASSLGGHVMVEKARRDGIRANQRLQAALSAQTTLTRQIEALSAEKDLIVWAKRNGFVAPQVAVKTSGKSRVTVVASL